MTYALLAWGIAEQTRLFRDRANIGVSTLAALCHVDAAQISRIEAASQNVSVEAIARLARFLRFPLPQLIVQASQEWIVASVPDGDREVPAQPAWRPVLAPPGEVPHNLHLSVMRLRNGWSGRAPAYRTLGPSRAASWIVLEGSLEVQLRDAFGRGDPGRGAEAGDGGALPPRVADASGRAAGVRGAPGDDRCRVHLWRAVGLRLALR